ncbi:hypothetical protein HPB52_001363 [Rhipicephalus sanguineus]|uniref:CCHC-type domain-containing protein n=1 Tax=Rhipicephalus sanguineus TaxID=34632 RepID=A0A9D4PTW2_RHISA|nr:hypothetical protein HPB52_001363 [Rhipicephalus sanguineus]
MVRIWKRNQAQSESASQQQRGAAAGCHPPVAQGAPACRPTGGAPTSASSSLPARQHKWRPRQTPRLSRDDYIVVVKPRVPCELRTCVPADRAGDAIRNYLGDRSTTLVQVWPIWEQNIFVCSTTMLPMAQKLLGDFQLQVGGQQLPVRGHAKASGDTCRGMITINPAEAPEKIKSELYWPRGTILAVRKLGESAAAVVTFEGTKLPRFLFYHCVATYIRPYKKTVPACTRCGTIGHRPPECPHPTPTQCAKCGIPAPEGLTDHDCHLKCLLCHGAHETGTSGCAVKYRKTKPPSTSRGPTSSSEGTRMHQTGASQPANTQAFPPLVAPAAVPQAATPATSKPSPRATYTPKNPPAPVADEPAPAAPAVSGAPQAPLPTNPTQPSEDRVPRIEERLTRVEASINHLITNFSVQRIVVEVTQAIQAWATTQFQPKASRSRSSSVNSAGSAPRRRRKVATTTLPPDNPASPAVLALQESGATPTLSGYCSYMGGTTACLLVHKAYTAIQIDLDLDLPYDYCMISVLPQQRGQPSIHILNVYCPPRLAGASFAHLFHRALRTAARQPLVIVGDFNAPSPHWGYHYEKARGRELKELISSLSLTLLTDPAQPTRSGNSVTRDTCPDLSLTRNIRDATWENLGETLGSDHFMIRICFTPRQKMRQHRGQACLTDWTKFRMQPFPAIPDSGEYAEWASYVLHTQRANTRTLTTSNLTPAIGPHLLHLWDARRGLIKRWKPQIEERLQKAALLVDTYAASCGLECSPAKSALLSVSRLPPPQIFLPSGLIPAQ